MAKPRTPRNVTQATELLDHYCELAAAATHLETTRNAAIAAANSAADTALAPLLTELEGLKAVLEHWWAKAGVVLAKRKKSVELGGCMIGCRLGNKKLEHSYPDEDQAIAALRGARLLASTTRTKTSLDKSAIVRLLGVSNATAKRLSGLGFRIDQAETFFVEPVEQEATIG